MREINLREARAKLGELAEAAHHGETITLTKHGRPYARLAPLETPMIATDCRVTVPQDSVPADWPTTGIVVEVGDETYVVELDNGRRQELPHAEVTAMAEGSAE